MGLSNRDLANRCLALGC